MTAISERMLAANNRPSGFDYMRITLATAVILSHTFSSAYGNSLVMQWWSGPERIVLGLILPPFFALSGFLVAGSLERTKSIVSFLGLRVIRLIPALAVEIVLSALVLGTIFTTLPVSEYIHSRQFHHYFLNIIGDIHYFLPGVFANNPSTFVNQQLWTVPFEMECYAALAALALLGIASRRAYLLGTAIALQLALAVKVVIYPPGSLTLFSGHVLVGCFLAGLVVFKFRDRIPHDGRLCLASLAMTVVLLMIPGGDYFLFAPAAYVTAWIGTLNPPRHRVILSGDYSYGLFLYGFPIQQAFTALGDWTHHWWLNMLVAYPIALGFAAFSWWCIEKPALGLKTYVMKAEQLALRVTPVRWHSDRVFSAGQTGR